MHAQQNPTWVNINNVLKLYQLADCGKGFPQQHKAALVSIISCNGIPLIETIKALLIPDIVDVLLH